MTGFTPELVERVAQTMIASEELEGEIVAGTSAQRIAARSLARAALEASGIAELTEALEDATDALKIARAVVAHHNPNGSANLDAIDRVLAKIGGSHGR